MGCLKKEIQDIVDAGRALWQLPPPGSRGSRLCSRNLTDSQKSAADEINERDLCEFCPVCSLKLTSRAHARDHYRGKPHDKQFRKKTLERQIPKKVVYALERINDDIDKTWQSEFIVYSKMPTDWKIDYRKFSQPTRNPTQKRKMDPGVEFAKKFSEISERNSNLYEEAYRQRDRKQFAAPIQADSVVSAGLQKQREKYSIIAPKQSTQQTRCPGMLEAGEVLCDDIEELSDEEEVVIGFDETLDKLYERNTRRK